MPFINFETLKDFSQVKKYERGTVFSRNGIGSKMYVILQGEVAILDSRDNSVIATIGSGNFFDESLLFSDKKTAVTSVAETDVIALPINKLNIASFIENEPKFTFELMKAMFERIEKIGAAYEEATGRKWTETNDHEKRDESSNDLPIVATHNEFELFPDGHTGNYELALTNDDNTHMCEVEYKCPVCGRKFTGLRILTTKLGAASTDDDMRRHYKDFDPTYYQVITCPHCLYSAFDNIFEAPDDTKSGFAAEIKALKKIVDFKFGTKPDTATVFAGYYLALFCAPRCFSRYQMIQAKLLHRLSWLYHDCKDEQMEMELTKQALEKYLKAYSELEFSPDQEQQLCMIIGELFYKLGNITEAKNFYYNAKINKQASVAMRRRADYRLDAIKEIELSNTRK